MKLIKIMYCYVKVIMENFVEERLDSLFYWRTLYKVFNDIKTHFS